MQILTKKQVKYRRLVTQKSGASEYCLGIEFQAKLFISDKFFVGDRQQQAIDYCQSKYLTEQGKTAYLLVSNVAGLTVWREDKIARIVGKQSPEDAIADLKLDRFLVHMQEISRILPRGERNNILLTNFQISCAKLRNLEQKVRTGAWLESVESIASYNTLHHYVPFN